MSMIFSELQNEVKRRAIRDQSGTTYDLAVKNIINTSLFRLSRESLWRSLRRKTYFTTKTSYSTGTASITSAGTTLNVLGASFLTNGIEIGRRVKISGSSIYYTIRTVTGATSCTLDQVYGASATTSTTYEILPQEQYNLPIQCGHRMFLWHEEYGYPYMLQFIPEQEFWASGNDVTEKNVPTGYRMWGEDMVKMQILSPTTLSVFSTSTADTNKAVTVFGTVGGYPDYEIINSNGTTVASGSKTFSEIERVIKNDSTTGRISVTASGDTSLVHAVMPVGDTTAGIQYKKIQLYPLPNTAFNINVQYYKDPYRLVNDGDVHELGQEFDEAIILLSVSKIKAENSQQEAANFYSLYKDELSSLKKTNADKIDWIPHLKRPYPHRNNYIVSQLKYSQLGGYYGPSS